MEDDDDQSSCGKSFSGDELSEHELNAVQGDILNALKRFDDIFNKNVAKGNKFISQQQKEIRKQSKARE